MNIFFTRYDLPPVPMKILRGYVCEIYICQKISSWGWATWKERRHKADWEVSDYEQFTQNMQRLNEFDDGGEDLSQMLKSQMAGKLIYEPSGSITPCLKNTGYCNYPVHSFNDTLGCERSGVHCDEDRVHKNQKF